MRKPFSSLYFGSNTMLYMFIFNSFLYHTSKLYLMAFICFWNHHLVIGSFCLSGVDWSSWWNDTNLSLHTKESVFRVILVRIFPAFSCFRIEYGEIRSISPYSVRMRGNAGKMRTRKTPNKDTFYAVFDIAAKLHHRSLTRF